MGVYIKGMKMPKNCESCIYFHRTDYGNMLCNAFVGGKRIFIETQRQDYCPLTEVPEPHGRLIDADMLILDFNDWWYSTFREEQNDISLTIQEAIGGVEDMPTVIEGSE